MELIDYGLLHHAINFYTELGYHMIDVPWIVDKQYLKHTCPDDNKILSVNEQEGLVGSAEQSFFSIISDLEYDQLYMAVTPCFRPEDANISPYHFPYFIKLELGMKTEFPIIYGNLAKDAMSFHSTFTGKKVKMVAGDLNQIDLMIDGVEIGSYGGRWDMHWIYGTGLALPRFSMVR